MADQIYNTQTGFHSPVNDRLLKRYQQNSQVMTDIANQNILPTAMAQYNAAAQTSPLYNQLMMDLYRQYAPQLAQIGSDIGRQVQMSAAQNNADVANSASGKAALNAAIAADQAANPEFYSSRALEGSRLADLLNSIDLSGNLSGSELRSIDQYLGRSNARQGTLNAPSQLNTVKNATLYGDAAYQRREQAKSDLNQALSQATQFLPQSRSPLNAWGISTGNDNGAVSQYVAPSLGMFQGINNQQQSSQYGSLLNNMLSNQANMYGSFMNAWKDESDSAQAGHAMSGAGSFMGGMGSMMG